MTLGCSRFQAFRRVALPLALPGVAASAIFVFVTTWNEVFAAALLTLLLALLIVCPLSARASALVLAGSLMGGDIEAVSRVGLGSEFVLTIPAAPHHEPLRATDVERHAQRVQARREQVLALIGEDHRGHGDARLRSQRGHCCLDRRERPPT